MLIKSDWKDIESIMDWFLSLIRKVIPLNVWRVVSDPVNSHNRVLQFIKEPWMTDGPMTEKSKNTINVILWD